MLTSSAAAASLDSLTSTWQSVTMEDSWFTSSLPSSSYSSPTSLSSPSHSPSTLSAIASLSRRSRRPGKLAAGDSHSPLTPHLYPRTPFCSPNSSPHPLDRPSLPTSSPSSPSSPPPPSTSTSTTNPTLLSSSTPPPPANKRSSKATHAHGHPHSSHLTITISPHSTRSHSMPYLHIADLLFHPTAGDARALLDDADDSNGSVSTPHSSPCQQPLLPAAASLSPLLLSASPVSPSPLHRRHHNSPALRSPVMQPCAGSPTSAAFVFLPSSLCSSPTPATPAEWSRRMEEQLTGDDASELIVPPVLQSPLGSPQPCAFTPHPSPAMTPISLSSGLIPPLLNHPHTTPSRSLLLSSPTSSTFLYDSLSCISIESLDPSLPSPSYSEEEKRPHPPPSVDHSVKALPIDSSTLPTPRVIIRVTSADDHSSSGCEVNSDSE